MRRKYTPKLEEGTLVFLQDGRMGLVDKLASPGKTTWLVHVLSPNVEHGHLIERETTDLKIIGQTLGRRTQYTISPRLLENIIDWAEQIWKRTEFRF